MIEKLSRLWAHRWVRYPLSLVIALWGIFCCGAVYYNFTECRWLRTAAAIGLAATVAILLRRAQIKPRHALRAILLLAAVNLLYLALVRPSNCRDWQPSFARNPRAELNGDLLIVRDVRDFHYRSEHDFDAVYIDETYDLNKLDELDFIVVHWGSEAIAHTMIGFHFSDGKTLVFSMETRLDTNDAQGALPGLFRQFELLCIAGTERDLVGLRTNFRHEDVYFYPTMADRSTARRHLLSLASRLNELAAEPEFYNTITQNCTTSLIPVLSNRDRFRRDIRLLLNGFSDRLAFEAGELAGGGGDFASFKARHYLNPRLENRDIYAPGFDYPAFIREGL